jgi:hypothetical protein
MSPSLIRTVVRNRAIALRNLRKLVLTLLYPVRPPARGNAALQSLANAFSRYAGTQPTAYESGVASTSSGGPSLLVRQVQNAVAQVVACSPNADNIGTALVEAFPAQLDGTIAPSPSRSVVSLAGDGSAASAGANGAGLSGQISAEQAALYRQVGLIVPDALRVLAGLRPFATLEQPDVMESLRGLIETALRTLLEEFGRVDEPRAALVDDYLSAIGGPHGFVAQLGAVARIDGRAAYPDSFEDEQQIAGFKLLKSYVHQLREAWNAFGGVRGTAFPLFTERLQRANQMLEVVAQGNVNLMSAMDSIGFRSSERRSPAARFSTLQIGPRSIASLNAAAIASAPNAEQALQTALAGNLTYSDMTVDDFSQWVDKLARGDGPRLLADAGQFGLEFVTGQADTLFYTIVPALFATKRGGPDLNSSPIVAQVFQHERVSWALDDLVYQLDALADLA